jgi:hypothetical protein
LCVRNNSVSVMQNQFYKPLRLGFQLSSRFPCHELEF